MANNVPLLLLNGELAGTPVPASCSVGDPNFYDTSTGILYFCAVNSYVPLTGGTGTGTVTHSAGPLGLNLPVVGNGGADVKAGTAAQLVPTLPADATKFLDGTGAFSVPATGSGTVTHTSGALTVNLPAICNGGADIKAGLAAQLVPTLTGNANQVLNGTGSFGLPNTITTQSQPSRSFTTIFQNTSPNKPVFVNVVVLCASGTGAIAKTDNSNPPTTVVALCSEPSATPTNVTMSFVVMPGNFYQVTGAGTLNGWTEWQ